MADQPGGVVSVTTGWHPKQQRMFVILVIPGYGQYVMPPSVAREVAFDMVQAAAVAKFDEGVYLIALENGESIEETQEYLRRVGIKAGNIDVGPPKDPEG